MEYWQRVLIDILDVAEKKDYAGYSKFDALNSPLLRMLSLNNKWFRLLYTQIVKELPINIRPFLKVKKSRNPKGIALFANAYLLLFQRTQDHEFLKKGIALIEWLFDNRSPRQDNLCWGYNFIWQSTIFLQDEFEPNAVVTAFVGEALIQAYRVTNNREYLDAACSVADFIVKDLPVLYESGDERAIAYVLQEVDAVVLNNQVLTAAFLVKVWRHTGQNLLMDIARHQINYTVNRRTDYFAWYYTHPKEKSNIIHDNYHTGGILDGLVEYFEETGDDRYMDIYWKGLAYYQENLFEPNGAPRWMNDKKYPFDIHGSASGIISFAKAGKYKKEYFKQASKIVDWTMNVLYREKTNDFAYRQGRFVKWNYSLMRWCNAWMARAFAELNSQMD
ncbi:MAG: glycoside hydrolase family 127 protein [Thermodesulfobacteriota bacterium]|nr:glycoside hydrolase family 127 protein [Thermodesulfobacteriota bacterium]